MSSIYQPIYDYFDYEKSFAPDYDNDSEEAQFLVAYLKDLGYTYHMKSDKVVFKKDRKTFVGVGNTENAAIARAFMAFLRSYR